MDPGIRDAWRGSDVGTRNEGSLGSTNSFKWNCLDPGATGQDGAYLAELLLKKGYVVQGIKRR
jgi:hypothetical protein